MKKGIISVLSMMAGAAAGAGAVGKVTGESLKDARNMSNKHLSLFLMMNQWVNVKQEGKNLASYFEKNGYSKIAIYGMSYAGKTLYNELSGTGIEVAYGIDQKAVSIYADIDIVSPDDALDDVDVIVVAAITFFDEVKDKLSGKVSCPIVSLENVVYEV